MPYINRDKNGSITGAFHLSQFEGQEFIQGDKPEIVAFRNRSMEDPKRIMIQKKMELMAIQRLKEELLLEPEYPEPILMAQTEAL